MPDTAIAYGDSGCGKTTICVSLAKWVYETWGLTTRLISSEGWEPVENEGLIKAGIVSAFNISARPRLLSDVRKLSRGYWPKVIEEEVAELDENGIEIGRKKQRVRRIVEDKEEFNKVGLYFIETLDGISNLFMKYLINREVIAEDEKGQLKLKAIGSQGTAGRYEEDGEVLGSNSGGHYWVVQSEMYNLVNAINGFSGNLKMIFWTAHVGLGKMGNEKSTDSKTGRKRLSGEPCYCPLLVGEAMNALIPSWVGDCFHFEEIPRIMNQEGNEIQGKIIKAHYERHRESGFIEGTPYLAKSRVGLSDLGELNEQFPGGFINLGVGEREGLDQYYRWLHQRKGGNLSKVKEWKERIDANNKRS